MNVFNKYPAHNRACTDLADPTISASGGDDDDVVKFRLVSLCYSEIFNASVGLSALKCSNYSKVHLLIFYFSLKQAPGNPA